jgi:hypothetical protein
VLPLPPGATLVYNNDFSATPGEEWSKTTRTTSPSGQTFLGEFANDTAAMIAFLPPHSKLVVAFDVYILKSWDGTDDEYGPDSFAFGIDGVDLLNAQFANVWWQNYPTDFSWPCTNAIACNSLGYTYWGTEPMDATYRMTFTIDHTSMFAFLAWRAFGLQYVQDESWGIDNVTIGIIP